MPPFLSIRHPTRAHTVDSMGQRIDDLEKSISDLMQQAGLDEQVRPFRFPSCGSCAFSQASPQRPYCRFIYIASVACAVTQAAAQAAAGGSQQLPPQ